MTDSYASSLEPCEEDLSEEEKISTPQHIERTEKSNEPT